MENIRIEVFTERYRDAVIDLILHIQQKEFGIPITLELQPDLMSIPEFYQQSNGNFWIALHHDKVVGSIGLIDIGMQQLAIRKMFVEEAFRGKPYSTGQLLLDAALHWMQERKCKQVFLGTLDILVAAQKFYRRNGFTEIKKADLPSNFPAMKLDNTFFTKDLTADVKHASAPVITIHNYEAIHQPWFEKFNRDWIEKYFWMEPIDIAVLQQPEEHILSKGGNILMAFSDKEVAGTVALKYVSPGIYEFTKMAVDEKFRGKSIGKALAHAAIEKAKAMGAHKIILYSSTILTTAINLYRKLGFVEVPLDGIYKRSDIKMELVFK